MAVNNNNNICKTVLHLVSTFRLCQSTNWHFCRLLSNPSRAEVQIKHNSIFKALRLPGSDFSGVILPNAIVAQARACSTFYHFCYCYAVSGQHCNIATLYMMWWSQTQCGLPCTSSQNCLGMHVVKIVTFLTQLKIGLFFLFVLFFCSLFCYANNGGPTGNQIRRLSTSIIMSGSCQFSPWSHQLM